MNQFPSKTIFTLPNEIFSLGLGAGEIAVYAYLRFSKPPPPPTGPPPPPNGEKRLGGGRRRLRRRQGFR